MTTWYEMTSIIRIISWKSEIDVKKSLYDQKFIYVEMYVFPAFMIVLSSDHEKDHTFNS